MTLPKDLPETHVCRYCNIEQPADADHFFPHRASGGLHLKSRCRICEKSYRASLTAATAKGRREVRPRPRSTEAVRPSVRSAARLGNSEPATAPERPPGTVLTESASPPTPPSFRRPSPVSGSEQRLVSFERELDARIGAIFASHPELEDHRAQFPWVTGYLGDPFATVSFVPENPSLGQMRRPGSATRESQWAISPGDLLLRRMLAKHGFKIGEPTARGGWRCYITDVIKSAVTASEWSRLPVSEQDEVADAWAPVLSWEIATGQPRLVVAMGHKADRHLRRLQRQGHIPTLPQQMRIDHYSSVAMRPKGRLPPNHPARLADYDRDFAAIAVKRRELESDADDQC